MTRLALLSDIHANLPALEAVVADIDRHAPDAVYVLGDLVNGCAWPVETLDLLTGRGWPMLIGNHDDAVLQLGTPRMEARYGDRQYYATLWWTRARLRQDQVALLAALPEELSLAFAAAPAVRLLHGLPGNFFAGFHPDAPEDWMLRHLSGIAEPTVADGHTHFPMVRRVSRWQVINSGSAGAPYDGDPCVSYVVMEASAEGWQVTIRRIDYNRRTCGAGISRLGPRRRWRCPGGDVPPHGDDGSAVGVGFQLVGATAAACGAGRSEGSPGGVRCSLWAGPVGFSTAGVGARAPAPLALPRPYTYRGNLSGLD